MFSKSGRPLSGVNRGGARIHAKSPHSDKTASETISHINMAQQSYHQHKMAQQLLAQEEQMARE